MRVYRYIAVINIITLSFFDIVYTEEENKKIEFYLELIIDFSL